MHFASWISHQSIFTRFNKSFNLKGKQSAPKPSSSTSPEPTDSIRQLTISKETFDNLKKHQDEKTSIENEKIARQRQDELRREEENRRREEAQMLSELKQKRWQDEQSSLERDFEFENTKAKNRQDQLTRSYKQHERTFDNLVKSRNSEIERGLANYKRHAEDAASSSGPRAESRSGNEP